MYCVLLVFPLVVFFSAAYRIFFRFAHKNCQTRYERRYELFGCTGCVNCRIEERSPSRFFADKGYFLCTSTVCVFLFMFSILSRRCPLLATSCPSFSVCFPCSSPIPGLIWFGSVYLVTTAGFVADQLM